jgi:hypothetical protein
MKPFFQTLAVIAAIVLSIFIIWQTARVLIEIRSCRANNSQSNEVIDSLKTENRIIQFTLDSLVKAYATNELIYKNKLGASDANLKIYKFKIKEYEKALNAVGSMSNSAILDSITGYYKRQGFH